MKNGKFEFLGNTFWFLNDLLHNTKGPAVIYWNGRKDYYLFGEWHREGGPAIEHVSGCVEYFQHGKRHRLDGPAVIDKDKQWWFVDGKQISRTPPPSLFSLLPPLPLPLN